MAITSVWVKEDCTACELCVDTCPDVFEMGDEIAQVKEGVNLTANESCIHEAAEDCPVEAIQFDES